MSKPWLGRSRSGFTVIEVVIVLVLIILIIGLSLPSTGRGHSAAARTQATNNIRQLLLGMHFHQDTQKKLPFNGVKDSWADPMNRTTGSWAYQILPYIEQDPLYRMGAANKNAIVPVLLCPARERPGFTNQGPYAGTVTDYAINTWLADRTNGSIHPPDTKSISLAQIMDGTSNTYMLGQLALPVKEYDAMDAAPGRETIFVGGRLGTGRNGMLAQEDGRTTVPGFDFGSPFPAGAYFGMGDGSVRSVAYSVNLMPGLRPDDGMPAPFID